MSRGFYRPIFVGQECPPGPTQFALWVVHVYDNDPSPGVAVTCPHLTIHRMDSAARVQAYQAEGNVGDGQAGSGVCPVQGAGGGRAVPLRGSGCAVGKMSTTGKAVDGMLGADGGIVDGEEEGDVGGGRDAVILVPVVLGALPDEGVTVERLGAPHPHVTATAAASINFTGTFDSLTIHYRQVAGGGSFRYRVDAGSWTTVDTNGATAYGTSTISGLADASHAVNVEWVSGTVVVFGAYMTSGSTGIVVNRCGHTGMTTVDLAAVNGANWTAAAAAFGPDLAIITLGTNDQTGNVTPATYVSNMATIIGRLPAGCDVIVAMPADTIRKWLAAGATTYSIYNYAEAMYAAGGWDAFHNPDDFGSYGYSLNMAYWLDSLHLNATGSNRFADLIITAFLTGW